jgi:hypothetical protein
MTAIQKQYQDWIKTNEGKQTMKKFNEEKPKVKKSGCNWCCILASIAIVPWLCLLVNWAWVSWNNRIVFECFPGDLIQTSFTYETNGTYIAYDHVEIRVNQKGGKDIRVGRIRPVVRMKNNDGLCLMIENHYTPFEDINEERTICYMEDKVEVVGKLPKID